MNENKNNYILLENLPMFEEILSTFTFMAPDDKEGWSTFEVRSDPCIDSDTTIVEPPNWLVWYKESSNLNLSSLRSKTIKLLTMNGHLADERICDIVLVGFTMLHNNTNLSITCYNAIIEKIVNGTANHFFSFTSTMPFRNNLDYENMTIGNFIIGPFPSDLVSSRCRRAGSDFAKKYEDQFRSFCLSIYREPQECKIINWSELIKANKKIFMLDKKLYPLIDHYFFCLSQLRFELFFEEFKTTQEIPQAFGSGWFDVDTMKTLFDTHWLTIWLDIGKQKWGWVSPGKTGHIEIDLGGFHIGLPFVYSELVKRFGDIQGTTALDKVTKLYCSYLAKAWVFENKQNAADALLNYVIALDLLLGENGSSTESFSSRCSALTCLTLDRDYKDLKKECKQVYDTRSRYVHRGKKPKMEDVQRIKSISREIALCLFRLKNTTWSNEEKFRDKWIVYVDLLAAKLNANQLPTNDDYVNAGVAQHDEYNYYDIYNGLNNHRDL